jgi:ABC-type proline/glycine betaine transport system permease subunit
MTLHDAPNPQNIPHFIRDYNLHEYMSLKNIIIICLFLNTLSTFVVFFSIFYNVIMGIFGSVYYILSSLFSTNVIILVIGFFIGIYTSQKYNYKPIIDYFCIDKHVDSLLDNKNTIVLLEYIKKIGPTLIVFKEKFINATTKISHIQ